MLMFKNSELEAILINISLYSSYKEGEIQKMISGLLMEDLSLGVKRRLQKIHKKVYESYKEFLEDFKRIQENCKIGEDEKKEPVYNEEKLKKEVQELLDEVVKIDVEPVQLSLIENISTVHNYNFDIIEKFAT